MRRASVVTGDLDSTTLLVEPPGAPTYPSTPPAVRQAIKGWLA